MNSLKLQDLVLFQMELVKQGLPKDKEVEETIVEVSNLILASQYVGNIDTDNSLINNRINAVLGRFQQQKPFFINLFS